MLCYMLKSSTQAKVFCQFPFISSILFHCRSKNNSRNLRQNSNSYLLLQLQLFAFVNVLVSFWQTRNNNDFTKRIVLLSSQQFLNQFLKYCVKMPLEQKNTCDSKKNAIQVRFDSSQQCKVV